MVKGINSTPRRNKSGIFSKYPFVVGPLPQHFPFASFLGAKELKAVKSSSRRPVPPDFHTMPEAANQA